MKKINECFSHLNSFLFKEGHFEQLGIFRFLLCSILFYIACFRQFNIEQYTSSGFISRENALTVFPEFYKPLLQLFFWPDALASQIHLLYIGLLFFAALGLLNRPLMFLTWIIAQGFIQRNFSMLFGADVIGNLLLFYLSFTRCNEFFSLKHKILRQFISYKSRPYKSENFFEQLSSVAFRLLQFQIITIYTYTGLEKLKGTTWWDGTALWTVLVNPQFSAFDLVFLKGFPLFFAIGTFVTIIFEVYFGVMVAFKKTRYVWLSLGVLFHLMIGILLGLMPFSLIMMSTYILFVESNDICSIKRKISIYRDK